MRKKYTNTILIAGLLLMVLLFSAAPASAVPPAMKTYCAVPPFLASATQPNIMVILDNSGSMEWAAYSSGFDPTQFVNGHYYGLFDATKNYRYDTSVTPNRWVPTLSGIDTGTVTNPIASGDLLNWASMKRVDVSKKLLIGGRASSGAYVAADRTTSPVKLYAHATGSGSGLTKNYVSPTTAPYTIYPFTGDYEYAVNGRQLTLTPNTAGTITENVRPNSNISIPAVWTVFPAASNAWADVDDNVGANDGDTTYIQNANTTSPGNTAPAIFGYKPYVPGAVIAANPNITNVQIITRAKKAGTSTSNTRRVRHVVRIKGPASDIDYQTGTGDLSTNYSNDITLGWPTNPYTGAAWQWADLTGVGVGSIVGYGVMAGSTITATNYIRVTQVYMKVTVSNPSGTYDIIIDQGTTAASGILDTMAGDVRFGLAYYNGTAQGAYVNQYVNFGTVPAMIQSISDMDPSTWTPLAETMYEVTRYFRQETTDSGGTLYSNSDYIRGCAGALDGNDACSAGAAVNTRDPYFFDFQDPVMLDGYVPCAKSFVLFLTDGESTQDLSLPGTTAGTPPVSTTACDISNIKGCSGYGTLPDSPRYGGTTVGTTYASSGTDYLVDVAYWARTADLRPGTCTATPSTWSQCLPGTQNITLYPVFLFGRGSTLLKDAAIYGGFEDLNGNNRPDCTTLPEECYRDTDGDGVIESNGQDDPITYYEGDDGYQLEASIIKAINAILARTASGTAASVLASGEGSGANLVQSIFYPKRSFLGSSEVSWIGTLANMWYFIDPKLSNSNIREDSTQDRTLRLTQDKIVEYFFDPITQQTSMNLFADTDGNGLKDGAAIPPPATMDTLKYLWEAGRLLFQQTAGDTNPASLYSASGRTILTNIDNDSALDAFSTGNAATLRPHLGLTTNSDASNLIRFIRGVDGITVDLDGDGVQDPTRSRATTVNINGTDENGIWKLGDIINSTPKITSWLKLHKHDETYQDLTYESFRSSSDYTSRGMVFVGGNDGMLHAFKLGLLGLYNEDDRKATLGNHCSVTTTKGCSTGSDCPPSESCTPDPNIGKEAWAFIPKNALPYLLYQAREDYCHLYSIDASPVIFDASFNKPTGCTSSNYWECEKKAESWRTVLIGSMRYGGACRNTLSTCTECVKTPVDNVGYSSYFALDITNPESPSLLWEYSDTMLGLSTTDAAIVRINAKSCSITTSQGCNIDGDCPGGQTCDQDKSKNGKWFVVVGTGPTGYVSPNTRQFMGVSSYYDSTDTSLWSASPKLQVLDLATGSLLRTMNTFEHSGFIGSLNGATIDVDLNYSDDALYFGYTRYNWDVSAANRNADTSAADLDAVTPLIGNNRINFLDTSAVLSSTNDWYNGKFIEILDGSGHWLTRMITGYDGANKIATLDSPIPSGTISATDFIFPGWNTGGVGRVFTKESLDPDNWVVSKVIATTGPVTSTVSKVLNIKDHTMRLYFGTGRYFYKLGQIVDDAGTPGSVGRNRLYGVKDPCIIASTLPSKTKTAVDTTCATTVSESSLGAANQFTNTDGSTDIFGNSNTAGSSDADGWYIPLQAAYGSNGSERSITNPLATTIGVIFFTTTKPSTDVCTFGGQSYIWAVRYDTGGSLNPGTLKGKAMIQLSTGAIQEVDTSSAFNAQGNRRTSILMQGIPPMDQSVNIGILPAPMKKILHMQKK